MAVLTREDFQAIDHIDDVAYLEDLLSAPSDDVVNTLARLDGDILILGVAGKMGPSLARMARRAFDESGDGRRVIGAARFSSSEVQAQLEACGVETIPCDLLDRAAIARLPAARNVIFMAGRKFGSTGQESLTWAMNVVAPAHVGETFRESRIVAFSTGNVYGLSPVGAGGSRESDALQPSGEYAMSCLGRERVFEHVSVSRGTPVAIIRLNYAAEMRYGVLVDIAQAVHEGAAVDLAMGYFNTIWQGDANAQALCALAHASNPPLVLNVAGPEVLSVRQVASDFGDRMNRSVRFAGTEGPDALLSDSTRAQQLFGRPRVAIAQLLRWTAEWIARGAPTLRKPTHFQVRDGRF